MGSQKERQKIQDWITQKWVVLSGRKISKSENWLIGPFGLVGISADNYIDHLVEKEGLIKFDKDINLINSINDILTSDDANMLSKKVKYFYENTYKFSMSFTIHWNPIFQIFGNILNKLFSNRIKQLKHSIYKY